MDLKRFGEKLREQRALSGYTQAEIAYRLNVTPQTVSKWERGLSAPDLDNLILLCDLMGVSLDSLLRDDSAASSFYAAIDGGGTKTEFILINAQGHVLKRVLRGSTNPNVIGAEQARANIVSGLDELCAGRRVAGAFAGVAGSLTPGNSGLLREAITSRISGGNIHVGSDILNVIFSVRGAERCIAVICGTGSSVFSWDGSSLHKYGGWGYLFDGAGSGYDIGCDILRACFAYDDGFAERTLLVSLAEEHLGGPAIDRLNEFYSGSRDLVAALSPIAFEAFRQGDRTARQIIERNIARLAELIKAANNGSQTVILSGGLTAQREIIVPCLKSMLPEQMNIVIPDLPQIYGAALAAVQFCKVPVQDTEEFDRAFAEDYAQHRKDK